MPVDRLSVTVPAELGAHLRTLAARRGETVSTVVADAIARLVRLAALDEALAAATKTHGPLSEAEVRAGETELRSHLRRASRKRSRR